MKTSELIIRVLDAAADRTNQDNLNPEITQWSDQIRELYQRNKSIVQPPSSPFAGKIMDFQTASREARIAVVEEILLTEGI